MDPITTSALITAGIPFVTAAIKKFFTKRLPEHLQAGVNGFVPLLVGILSTGLYAYQQTHDVWVALAAGLGSGGAASSVRDIDKNLTGIVESVLSLVKKKNG